MTANDKITVCGHRILVKVTIDQVSAQQEKEVVIRNGRRYSPGGIDLGPVDTDQELRAGQQGIVVQIGPEAYDIKSGPWCKVGDIVLFTRYVGKEIKGELIGEPGVSYIILNDDHVFAVLHK